MKATITVKQEIELKTLVVKAKVRYWEDTEVNGVSDEDGTLVPCRNEDLWCPIIDIDSGIITNWAQGTTAEVHYKVCDAGDYYLQDADGKTILSIEQYYVPRILCPKENGYGDYIIMDIDENGKIANWRQTLKGFQDED